MARKSQLRVYYGPHDTCSVALNQIEGSKNTVEVPLTELLETLGEAMRKKRAWVGDFRDEQVTISADLYEIIAACQHMKRPA
jgi:hypothetical protein